MPQIIFDWRGRNTECAIKPKITGRGLEFEGASMEVFPIIFFSPHSPETPEENAKRFSELSKQNKEPLLIDAMKQEFPFIETLSVEYNAGTPTVHASITGMVRKIPIGLISTGVNKLLSILLGIACYPGGAVLIDEIENGFHHSRLQTMWRLLVSWSATFNNTQIFATTHSREALEALAAGANGAPRDFCLIRSERDIRSPQATLLSFTAEEAIGAVESGFEVR